MSIPQDQVPNTVHTGNGVSTEFSYEFYAPDLADVYVAIDGVRVTSGWTAVRDSDETGRVIFETAPADGTKVTIYRSTPITQEETWSNGQAFYPGTVGSALDKLTMVAQELRGGVVNIPGTVVTADSATNANYASSAGSATRATYVTNVSSATNATSATSATRASYADSAGYVGPFRVGKTGYTPPDTHIIRISAGRVSIMGSSYPVGSGSTTVSNGGTVWLVGSSAAGGLTFSYTGTEPTSSSGCFYARIAKFENNAVQQFQFGDIVTVPFGLGGSGGGGSVDYATNAGHATTADTATHASSADTATNAGYATTADYATNAANAEAAATATNAGYATTADYASSAGYGGPFAASKTAAITSGATVKVLAGTVVVGPSRYAVGSSSVNVSNGRALWLVGTSSSGSAPTFAYSAATAAPTVQSSQFCMKIADVSGGVVRQIQYGEIATVQWNLPSGGGTMIFPDYGALESGNVLISSGGSVYSASSLEVGSTYTMTSAGYVRISAKNFQGDGCIQFNTGGTSMGLYDARSGGPGNTWILPLSSGATFYVTKIPTCDMLIKCDATVYK